MPEKNLQPSQFSLPAITRQMFQFPTHRRARARARARLKARPAPKFQITRTWKAFLKRLGLLKILAALEISRFQPYPIASYSRKSVGASVGRKIDARKNCCPDKSGASNFCFDSGPSIRAAIYASGMKKLAPEQRRSRNAPSRSSGLNFISKGFDSVYFQGVRSPGLVVARGTLRGEKKSRERRD